MSTGKLYHASDEKFLTNVNYRFQHESPWKWWGELRPSDSMRLDDGSGYILELEDNRRGRCSLRKIVNRAVAGVPPRYIYRFNGTSLFK